MIRYSHSDSHLTKSDKIAANWFLEADASSVPAQSLVSRGSSGRLFDLSEPVSSSAKQR